LPGAGARAAGANRATDVSEPALRRARQHGAGVFNVEFVRADWYAEMDASPAFD
jgi:hypothetical protein